MFLLRSFMLFVITLSVLSVMGETGGTVPVEGEDGEVKAPKSETVEGGTTEVTTSTPGLSSVRGRPSWLQRPFPSSPTFFHMDSGQRRHRFSPPSPAS